MVNLAHRISGRSTESRSWPRHLFLIVCVLVMIYPLLWMLGGSFKPNTDILSQLNPWPSSFHLSNYIDGWKSSTPGFTRYFVNSLIIAGLAVVGNVVACSMTAYAFARFQFRFRRILFGVMLVSIMLPAHALLIPQYFVYFKLGWVNTFLPLFVPKFLATDAFFIFLMVQFIRTLPRDLDESAEIDGCGPVRIFLSIIFPLLRPALITTAIFTFIWTYNDFLSQLIYLSYPGSQTVPVAMSGLVDSSGGAAYGQLLAMSVLSLVPTFVVFLVSQRHIVQGVATTGLR